MSKLHGKRTRLSRKSEPYKELAEKRNIDGPNLPINLPLSRKNSVCIVSVNLLYKRFPEIMAGLRFGFGKVFRIIVHRVV